MHSFKCILAGHYPVKSMSEKEREHVDLPPLTFLPLLFIKTLKFLEQLRTIISRDGEIATEERSNLCRQHFSTAKKTDQGGSSRYSRKISPCFGWRKWKGRRERENFILFSLSLLSRRFLLTALLTGNWKLLNFESIWLFRVTRNITNNETLNRKVDLWRLYRGNTRITRIHASVFLASINIETKKQTLRAKLEDPFSPSTSRVKIIGHDNMQ